MKPWIHAESSAKRFGGKPEDYIDIHNLMDSSKGAIADSRHRALTHTSWFLSTILERIFGVTVTNSNGRVISVREIGEQHILEDFRGRFIPTPQDYLADLDCREWMVSGMGNPPPSFYKLRRKSMSIMDSFKAAQKRMEEAREICNQTMKDAFVEGSKVLFDKYPELKKFEWRQYTPYFNDGEPCVFRAGNEYPDIYFDGVGSDGLSDEDGVCCEEGWTHDDDPQSRKDACKEVVEFLSQFDDDLYEEAFGDHAVVSVSREGVTVGHCDHD